MKICSFSPFGYEGCLVAVEVDLRRGIPGIDMVGLADGAVRESRERMRSAILNSGFSFPPERILISLSPADVKKEGSGFDLAVALAVLAAADKDTVFPDITLLVMGELELSGCVRPVRGIHAAVATAAEHGITRCIIPQANRAEAQAVSDMSVFAADTLAQAFSALTLPLAFEPPAEQTSKQTDRNSVQFPPVTPETEFGEITGQPQLVRALQIAAAGAHNIIAYGPPGCGKTMSMLRFPGLMPLLTEAESRPVSRIKSLAGLSLEDSRSFYQAPFRAPHQSASLEGIAGGGPQCRPGEISLAHNGALFLDEAAEFRTQTLQALRVPLESGCITLSRAGRSTTYPARFQLLLASNPCPCGNFGAQDKICLCGARAVEHYWKKFSAPLLDRIDIRVPLLSRAAAQEGKTHSITTTQLRRDIARAVACQRGRQHERNSRIPSEELKRLCPLTSEARRILDSGVYDFSFSPRAVSSCIKLARTIADMDGSDKIQSAHMEEAVSLRKNEGGISLCF